MSAASEHHTSPERERVRIDTDQAKETSGLGKPVRKTRRWVFLTGCVIIVIGFAFWRPLQRKCTAWFLLRAEAPADEALAEAVEQASDPEALLWKLWETEKVPHRQFVAGYLERVSNAWPELFGRMERLVLDATGDPDVEVRQFAFGGLERVKHPRLRSLALEQLSDADPAVRLIGLQALRRIANSNDVPIAIRYLKDPEPRVVVAAALVLGEATGERFGIKSSDALPQFTGIDTNPPPVPNLEAIQRGVKRYEEWWAAHRAEYQPSAPLPATERMDNSLTTADFKLQEVRGSPVQLSQFLGKTVLLVFWSPGAPASLDDVPALNALYERNAEHLVIIGICVPGMESCAGHEHGRGGGGDHAAHHHHGGSSAAPEGPEQFKACARDAAERLRIQFPMVVDPAGKIGRRFSAEDVPVYVLVDPRGKIRHRFVGFRSSQTLAAIVENSIPQAPRTANVSP